MKITRKEFLQLVAAGWVVVSGRRLLASLEGANQGAQGVAAKPRKRWGMIIDVKKCAKDDGCTGCIEACNKLHNIPAMDNPAHEIRWIWREPFRSVFSADQAPYMQESLQDISTLVMCNHCDDPPCVRVCPTGATWKRQGDGVVMMDWHRCIGCRYCMAACPYGSRSFNWVDPRPYIQTLSPDFPTRTKGVVEKCTFCAERLAKGKGPACVEACPEKALIFGDLNDPKSEIRQTLASGFFLRRKPELGTGPNTYYVV
jgi:[DsrC]-trisulfide reductase subunit O